MFHLKEVYSATREFLFKLRCFVKWFFSSFFGDIPTIVFGAALPKANQLKEPFYGAFSRADFSGPYTGVLFCADEGTVVRSIASGLVTHVERFGDPEELSQWGGLVVILHKIFRGLVVHLFYGMLKDIRVTEGQRIEMGMAVGRVGAPNTSENGRRSISALHFALYRGMLPTRAFVAFHENANPDSKYWPNPVEFIRDNGLIMDA